MKKNIHPDYHDITIVLTDKTKFQTRSTYGKAGAELVLDIDPRVHSAWTGGGQHLIDRSGQLSKFNKRYEQFNLGSGKAKPPAPEAAEAAEAAAEAPAEATEAPVKDE